MAARKASPTMVARNGDVRIDVPLPTETGPLARQRTVMVSGEAIEDFLRLGPDAAASMTDVEREQFVRENLEMILRRAVEITAAKVIVSDMRIDAPRRTGLPDLILVRAGQL